MDALQHLCSLQPALYKALHNTARWFQHSMLVPTTHRLHYAFNPSTGRHEDRSCPIRDMGTAADLAVLQRHLGGTAFDPTISATLGHWLGEGVLVHHSGDGGEPWCHLSAEQHALGEPSSVAHSAMLLLALAAWERHPDATQRLRNMRELAAGIMRQQRPDGGLTIYFEPSGLSDSGWQLYGGEAAFALATSYATLADQRLLRSAAAALQHYQVAYRHGRVDADERVFFANWQSQAAAAVHRHSTDPVQRRWLCGYLREVQEDIMQSGFCADVAEAPERQAVVEVACGLEGLAHALQACLAQAESEPQADAAQERRQLEQFTECCHVLASFLLRAQVKGGPAGGVGGFGHTLRPGAGQRADVTGHVLSAFVKLLEVLDSLPGGHEP